MPAGVASLTCQRCGQVKPALLAAPMPGKWGAAVLDQTCADCWRDWIDEQTRLINHERLVPADPHHRHILYQRMRDFLHLGL
jgi:Fe-S cluster biosynthesis and repair protein YggX